MNGRYRRNWWWARAVVRLAPGATVDAAQDEATAVHRSARADIIAQGEYDGSASLILAPVIAAQGPAPSDESRVARWLAGVSLIVLLIACFNVADLLLARAVRWRKELAVRVALGVSRARLLGQLCTESALLAGPGALASMLVARWGGRLVHQTLLPNVAFQDAGMSHRLLLFTGSAAVVTALLSGVLPALHASRPDVAGALKAGGRGTSAAGSRTRTTFLVAQASLSVVLLVGAGLFVRSLHRARTLDLGFDADRVAVVQLEWSGTVPSGEREAVYFDARDRLRGLPFVRAAATTYALPFWSSIGRGKPRVPGRDSIPSHPNGGPYINKVSSGYFDAMGLTILQGRAFTPADDAPGAPPVTILSESLARAIWPHESPLGQCLLIPDEDAVDVPCTQVVGTVENHNRQALVETDPEFLYYVNEYHPAFVGPPQALVAGTRGPARDRLEALRSALRGTSARIRFVGARTLQAYVKPQLRSWTLGASMFTVFGLLALVVASVGLYSVLAFDVALRRNELGIRAALGAGAPRLVRLVLRRAVGVVVLGVALGVGISWAASAYVAPLLFRVSPRDPWVYAGVAGMLLLIALLAGALPARRAARVDPRSALQAE